MSDPDDTWVPLVHRPTNLSDGGTAVIADERFGAHRAFLGQTADSA